MPLWATWPPAIVQLYFNLQFDNNSRPARDLSELKVPGPLVLGSQLVQHLGAGDNLPEAPTRFFSFSSVKSIEIEINSFEVRSKSLGSLIACNLNHLALLHLIPPLVVLPGEGLLLADLQHLRPAAHLRVVQLED